MIVFAIWLAAAGYYLKSDLSDPSNGAAMMVAVFLPFGAFVRWLWR